MPTIIEPEARYQESEKYFATITDRLKAVTQNKRSLSSKATEQLAIQLSSNAESPFALERTLSMFYGLGCEESEAVLTLTRARIAADAGDSKQEETSKISFRTSEETILLAVKELNKESTKKTKLPFHRATLIGAVPSLDKVLSQKDVMSFSGAKSAAVSCPRDSYPRYVGPQWPWNLQLANSQSLRSRIEDSGCNINHGPFKKNIKGWVSFFPAGWVMVYANGWGGNLAANDKNLFVKWWTLAPIGLIPWNLFGVLWTRHT